MKQRLDFQRRQEQILKKERLDTEEESEPQYCWANTMSDDQAASPKQNDIDDSLYYSGNSGGKRDSRVSRRDSRISQYIMNMVEPERNVQVFPGPNEVPMEELKI